MKHTCWVALLLIAGAGACKKNEAATEPVKEAPQTETKTAQEPAPGTTPETREHVDKDGVVRRGKTLSEGEAITVARVMSDADSLAGKTVKISGVVARVCTQKGCWMTLKEGDDSIRITFKDYGFFIPKSAAGMDCTLEGELAVKMLEVKEQKHYAEDAADSDAVAKIEGPKREVSVTAVGLELSKQG